MVNQQHARVIAVSVDDEHRFSKVPRPWIDLLVGHGVVGDAHAGATVQHRSRVARDPDQPNLRQVHLIDTSFFALAAQHGFAIGPGDLGENITTDGLDLLSLPQGTVLRIGREVLLQVTGLRNPCHQINTFRAGLLTVAVGTDQAGHVVRRVGIMAVVLVGGRIESGDGIDWESPPPPHHPLVVV